MAEDNQSISGKNSYRSIFKATSLFGGVQVYQILVGVIKSKIIALLLGPAGMGIQGLYQSALDVIKSLTACGLEQSAVRDISEANGSENNLRVGRTVATVRKLVWITGVLGLLATLLLSPLLSHLTFGNGDYIWGFVILSSTLLLNQLCAGQKVLLQGMRRLRDLAKASAIGSTFGLLVSIPLYYIIGVKGIVPTMVLISVTALLLSWHYSRKVQVERVEISMKEALLNGGSMLRMGVAMSVSGILATISAYIVRWFIRQQGGLDEVGLFSAGFLITNTYVGMIFSAMGTDYYPRLSAVNKDNIKCSQLINQQGEIAMLILCPVIIACIEFMPFIIRIIYSDAFLPANNYVLFAVSGMMFKAASWTISYVFLAKAEPGIFIINETISNIYCLINNVFGYYWGGLTGLGISFVVNYLLYWIQVSFVSKRRYVIGYRKEFYRLLIIQLGSIILAIFVFFLFKSFLSYIFLTVILFFCLFFSIKELDKRTKFVNSIQDKFKKKLR